MGLGWSSGMNRRIPTVVAWSVGFLTVVALDMGPSLFGTSSLLSDKELTDNTFATIWILTLAGMLGWRTYFIVRNYLGRATDDYHKYDIYPDIYRQKVSLWNRCLILVIGIYILILVLHHVDINPNIEFSLVPVLSICIAIYFWRGSSRIDRDTPTPSQQGYWTYQGIPSNQHESKPTTETPKASFLELLRLAKTRDAADKQEHSDAEGRL